MCVQSGEEGECEQVGNTVCVFVQEAARELSKQSIGLRNRVPDVLIRVLIVNGIRCIELIRSFGWQFES
jgi:hypothetical protein